jgi:FixJ family two-component response regulator
MVSSLATLPNVEPVLQAGACSFMVKPVNGAKINQVVQQCSAKSRRLAK